MADLTPRIEKLVRRLAGRRGYGAGHPTGGSPPELRPGDAGFAEAVAGLVAMPLAQYAREGAPLEIRIPWLRETVWFVADEGQAEELLADGVSRGRIWTTAELRTITASVGPTGESLRAVTRAKSAFHGEIAGVAPRAAPARFRP